MRSKKGFGMTFIRPKQKKNMALSQKRAMPILEYVLTNRITHATGGICISGQVKKKHLVTRKSSGVKTGY